MTNWYYLPVKKILDLILIIARSSIVIQLTAGKIIQMSIHTFGDCLKVGEIVYMTNWYYLPVKKILDLILIIVRSSMVIELTAGKIIQMSIYTFGDVMRLAFAYLNILVQITLYDKLILLAREENPRLDFNHHTIEYGHSTDCREDNSDVYLHVMGLAFAYLNILVQITIEYSLSQSNILLKIIIIILIIIIIF
ncbi:hypothetical protein E2986_11716 [Frieseomelitta varia]|uniref:Uncharacterized protein n=1 Tax=Frieseomelitta varia TaxID=561572 RepID=A0A833RYP9_9HYME|nr:hypothetical protein E2986_11716 [Frieseomelitta varia]